MRCECFLSTEELKFLQKMVSDSEQSIQNARTTQDTSESLLHSLVKSLGEWVGRGALHWGRQFGLLPSSEEQLFPFERDDYFSPLDFTYQEPPKHATAVENGSLLDVRDVQDIPGAVALVRKAIIWAQNRKDSFETHIELCRMIKAIIEPFRNDAAPIETIPIAERVDIIHDLSTLTHLLGHTIMDAYRERGALLRLHPLALSRLVDLIYCAKRMGKGIDEIETYPTQMNAVAQLAEDFYFSFENFIEENHFFQTLEALGSGQQRDPISTSLFDHGHCIGSERLFDAFLDVLSRNYGMAIREKILTQQSFKNRIGIACPGESSCCSTLR